MMQFDTQQLQVKHLRSFDLELTDENKAYQMALYSNRNRSLNEFNNMIEEIIPGIIQRNFEFKDGSKIKVKGVEIKFPKVQSDIGDTLLTPFISRMTGSTYKCDVYIDYVEIKNQVLFSENATFARDQTFNDDRIKTRKIGSFHALVGSNRCITSVKPNEFKTLDEWKMFLGECPSSPGSYLIHKGAEKSVILDEKLRTNCFLTFRTKGDNPLIETRITCMNNSETSLVRLRIGTHRPCIKVLFPHLKGKHYPLYLTFYLLYFSHNTRETNRAIFKLNHLEELIASFTLPEFHDAIIAYLKPSKIKFIELFGEVESKTGVMTINEEKIRGYITAKLSDPKARNLEADVDRFALSNASHNVPTELFNQCKTYTGKLANLSFMACQIILCGISKRRFDSRDGWDQKKLDSVVRLITSYVATTLVENIKSGKTDTIGFNFGRSDRKDTIVEARKCETLNAAIAERDKIDNQVDTRTNSLTLRKVDQTQFPIICPPKTPEGEKCGLSKELAALSHISYNQEYNVNRKLVFDDLFEPNIQYFSIVRSEQFNYKLATSNINGNSMFAHYGTNQNNISPDHIFFSKRILTVFKDQFKNKDAIYHIDGDTIWIKFLNLEMQPTQYGSTTFTGGSMYVAIPPALSSNFDIVTRLTKNPAYSPFSSIYRTEDCNMRIAFKNPTGDRFFSYVKHPDGSYTELYVSQIFVEDMKLIIGKKGKITIEDEICIVSSNLHHDQFMCKHWSGYDVISILPKFIEEKYEMLISNISEYISLKRSKKYSYSLTFNGNVITYNKSMDTFYPIVIWTDGKKILQYLKTKRRCGELPYDSCIYMNEKDNSIQFFDDSGRVMAPLLIINDEGDLIIDKLDSWKYFASRDFSNSEKLIERLYNEGSMELLDPKEMDTTLIATSLKESRNFAKLRKFLNKIDLTRLNSSIYFDESGYVKNEDMSVVIINGNTYDLEFTIVENIIDETPVESLEFIQDGVTYYGTYSFKKPQLKKTTEVFYRIDKPLNPIISNGYYMLYKYDDNYRFITIDSDEITDGLHVFVDDRQYEIEYFDFPKDKTYVYVDETLKIKQYIELQRPLDVPSDENNENLYYRYNDRWVNPSEIVDKYFIKIVDPVKSTKLGVSKSNETFKLVTEVFFEDSSGNAFNNGMFTSSELKINEYVPRSITTYQHYNEAKYNVDELDKYECDLHIVSIRRAIDELDKIDLDNHDFFGTLTMMKEAIPAFGNKRILLNIRKYIESEFKFTHVLIDPNAAFSVIANLVPKADSNPGPRWSYQCSMGTQALGVGNCVWYRRFETTTKRLIAPTQHAFETIAEIPYSQVTMSTTQNYIYAVLAHRKGFEDPTIISVNCLKKMGRYVKEITIKVIETNTTRDYSEIVCQPTDSTGNIKTEPEYKHIDGYGLPKIGSYIKVGECIVGRTKIYSNSTQRSNSSYFAGVGEDGLVSQIQIVGSEGSEGSFRAIFIKLIQVRYQQPGDKMAARFSQKGVIADLIDGMINDGDSRLKIVDDNLMPYVLAGPNAGLRMEIIFNPASFPSRMTCGLIKECLTSKASVYIQKKVNASNFHDLDMDFYNNALYSNEMLFGENGVQSHLDCNGNEFLCHSDGEIMIDSSTGKPFQAYIGIVAYQFLRHQVEDKKQARATGPTKPITHQPVEGKKNNGGARMGEMERDSLISSGAADTLFDRFMDSSDGYVDVFCKYCQNNSSMSNLKGKVCQICGTAGSLVSVAEPRIHKVFMHQMSAIGLNITSEFGPADDFQNDIYKKNIEEAAKFSSEGSSDI